MHKKTFIICILLWLLIFVPVTNLYAAELNIEGESSILMEASSGKILYAKEENKHWPPASITKLMTMALIMDALSSGKVNSEDKIVASQYACSMGGSQVWLKEGEERTLNELMIAIAVGSANDASVAVAEHIAGSQEAFVEMMNAKAKSLGMTNTNFVNSHGLPAENHYTSAKDMAILARYCLRYPQILDFTSTKEYIFRPEPKLLILYNTNKLLWWYQGADGFKTGWTPEAKRNLVATVKRDDLRLVSVVLGVEKVKGHFIESMKLLNYGFANYAFKKLYDAGKPICKVEAIKGTQKEVELIPARDIGALHSKGKKINPIAHIELSRRPTAPIKKGQKLGEIVVDIDNKEVERVDLLSSQDIIKANFLFNFKEIISRVMSLGAIR